jgi:hypothetical protein
MAKFFVEGLFLMFTTSLLSFIFSAVGLHGNISSLGMEHCGPILILIFLFMLYGA